MSMDDILMEELLSGIGEDERGGIGEVLSSLRLKAVLRLSLKGLPLPVPTENNDTKLVQILIIVRGNKWLMDEQTPRT